MDRSQHISGLLTRFSTMNTRNVNDLRRYEEGWAKEMLTFWRERMDKLAIKDSGYLYNSMSAIIGVGAVTTIEHKFALYGIYVAAGVGREFGEKFREANGTLPFLLPGGEEYREEHGLNKQKRVGPAWGGRMAGGHPRVKRDWFAKKYYSSVMRLNEFEASFYGEAYNGLLSTGLQEIFAGVGIGRNL